MKEEDLEFHELAVWCVIGSQVAEEELESLLSVPVDLQHNYRYQYFSEYGFLVGEGVRTARSWYC